MLEGELLKTPTGSARNPHFCGTKRAQLLIVSRLIISMRQQLNTPSVAIMNHMDLLTSINTVNFANEYEVSPLCI